jgi:hypothetical protein
MKKRTSLSPGFQFALAKSAPVLGAEQERALARRWREQGDRCAAEQAERFGVSRERVSAMSFRLDARDSR